MSRVVTCMLLILLDISRSTRSDDSGIPLSWNYRIPQIKIDARGPYIRCNLGTFSHFLSSASHIYSARRVTKRNIQFNFTGKFVRENRRKLPYNASCPLPPSLPLSDPLRRELEIALCFLYHSAFVEAEQFSTGSRRESAARKSKF